MATLEHLEQNLTQVEKGFNILGSMPVVGVFSGALRATSGKIQFISAAIFCLMAFTKACFSEGEEANMWTKRAQVGLNYMLQGAANVVRGLAEFVLATTFVGSFIPLTIQLLSDKGFAPRIEYQHALPAA